MKENRTKLKTYFQTGDQPTEQEFINWFDSSLILSGSNAITGSLIISGSQSDNQDNTPPNLHVMGDITSSGNIVAYGDVIAQNYIVSSSVTHIVEQTLSGSTEFGDDGGDTHQFTGAITASSNISASGYVNATKMGIGRAPYDTFNTFPEHALDIQGISPVFRIATDNAVAGNNLANASAIWMGENGGAEIRGAGLVYNGLTNALSIVTSNNGTLTDDSPYSGSARITIQETDGNVGVGTTSPSSKFHVAGTTRIELPSSANHFRIMGDVDSDLFYAKNESVWIGTDASSSAKLTVSGSISASGDILLDEDQRIYFEKDKQTWIEANGANLLRIVTNNNQMLLLDHETGNRAVFGNGSKVFIGDNNNALPDKELVVHGDISSSGIVFATTISSSVKVKSPSGSFSHIEGNSPLNIVGVTSMSFDNANLTGNPTFQGDINLIDQAQLLDAADNHFLSSNDIQGSGGLLTFGEGASRTKIDGLNIELNGPLTMSGHISSSGTGSFNNIIVDKNITVNSISASADISSSGAIKALSADINGNVDIDGGNLTVGTGIELTNGGIINFGTSLDNGRITWGTEYASLYGKSSNTKLRLGSMNTEGVLTISSSHENTMVISGSNVGIGNPSASKELTVEGDISASGDIFANNSTIAGTGSFTFISASSIVVGPESGNNSGELIVDIVRGMSPQSLLISNVNEMQAGGSGEPFLFIENNTNHDVRLGDVQEAENGTFIFIDDTRSRIEHSNDSIFNRDISIARDLRITGSIVSNITASGNISASGNIFTTGISASGDISSSGDLIVSQTITSYDGLDIKDGNIDFNSTHQEPVLTVYGGGVDNTSNVVFQLGTADQAHSAQLFTAPNKVDQHGSGKDNNYAKFTVNGHISSSGNLTTGPITTSGSIDSTGDIYTTANISASFESTASFGSMILKNLPTTPVGLPTGSVWVSGSFIDPSTTVRCGTLVVVI